MLSINMEIRLLLSVVLFLVNINGYTGTPTSRKAYGLEPRHHPPARAKKSDRVKRSLPVTSCCAALPLSEATTLAKESPHPGGNAELSAGTVRCPSAGTVALMFR